MAGSPPLDRRTVLRGGAAAAHSFMAARMFSTSWLMRRLASGGKYLAM
jgi:hypothetical protein